MNFIPKKLRRFVGGEKPIFSLCHTTARLPDGWKAARQAWFDNCDHPELVEHILCTDFESDFVFDDPHPVWPTEIHVVNMGRKCAVDGWNTAAKASSGKFLISLSDDLSPCPHWDTELLKVIPDLDGEYVVEVSTGGDEGVLTFSMLTRAYYERLTRDYDYEGGLFYAGDGDGYLGMYGDNEFTDLARRDGVIINAQNLYFEHKHPVYGTAQWDPTYQHQQRPEAYAHGRDVYHRRRVQLGLEQPMAVAGKKPKLAICVPGENFSASWVANWTALWAELIQRYDCAPIFCESSNVYVTRASMAEQIIKSGEMIPDYVLWIDDDNIVSPRHAVTLLKGLEINPQIAGIAGWCWCHMPNSEPKTSVGAFLQDGRLHFFSKEELFDGPHHLREIGFTGFPVFAMRADTLVKAGLNPFAPIFSNQSAWGFFGEDVSFCINAGQRGKCKFYVDRRVEVPHLKLRAVSLQDAAEVKKVEVA